MLWVKLLSCCYLILLIQSLGLSNMQSQTVAFADLSKALKFMAWRVVINHTLRKVFELNAPLSTPMPSLMSSSIKHVITPSFFLHMYGILLGEEIVHQY